MREIRVSSLFFSTSSIRSVGGSATIGGFLASAGEGLSAAMDGKCARRGVVPQLPYDRQCALPGERALTLTRRERGRHDFATFYALPHAPFQYASAEMTSPPPTVPRARQVW